MGRQTLWAERKGNGRGGGFDLVQPKQHAILSRSDTSIYRWGNGIDPSSSQTVILMQVCIPTCFESKVDDHVLTHTFLKFEVKYGWLHDKCVKNFNDNMRTFGFPFDKSFVPSGFTKLQTICDQSTRCRKPMTAFYFGAPTQHKFDGRSSRP
jgi:hypothetical protein